VEIERLEQQATEEKAAKEHEEKARIEAAHKAMEEKEAKECVKVAWKAAEVKKAGMKGRDPMEAATSLKKVC
jgi:hypothetical protein